MDKSFDLHSFLKKHKSKPEQFQNVAKGVKKRLETSLRHRKSSRLSHLDSIRNLQPIDIPNPISEIDRKVEKRRLQMEKWKEEKERKKKEAAALKKKPFLTGVVHPPLKYVPPPPINTKPSTSGRVTRSQASKAKKPPSQEKNTKLSKTTKPVTSFAPPNATFKPPELKNPPKLPKISKLDKTRKEKVIITFDPVDHYEKSSSKQSPKKTKACKLSTPKTAKSRTPRKSQQNDSKTLKAKDTTPKSESSSEERLRSPKSSSSEECLVHSNSLSDIPKTPENLTGVKNISPCVTLSRGKENARKEMKKKREEGLLDEDSSHMEGVEYFKAQLDSEVKRITEMCDSWEEISKEVPLNETAMEMLLGAVGQGRLLVSQKLAQFGSLIVKCANPEPGTSLVTPADLHGFWDMVFMQVENVDMRFKKLADLRDRNWVEEEQVLPTRKVAKVVKNNLKPAATSRLRDLIAAARKAKKDCQVPKPENENAASRVSLSGSESKTFEAGFFSVRSPIKSPRVSSTPQKASLLKDVLSSEAKKASASKNSAASLAMLRASFIGKSVDSPDETASEFATTPKATLNLSATPGKSILKSVNVASTSRRKSRKKSIKVVLFNDSQEDMKEDSFRDEDITDQEIENKENKKSKTKPKLRRQQALDNENVSLILTRSRRKSMNTPL